jgi:VanZ family protein
MIVIFYFSSRSTTGVITTDPTDRFYVFKSFHLIEYAVLGILLFVASQKIKIAIPMAYLYACTDEFHQLFTPNRTSKFTDTLIDLLGILIGLVIYKIIVKLFPGSFKRF